MKESEQFRHGVTLFNARKFFEAHEVWEELWLAESGPEKTFLQGLIQLAAAFHHHDRGNSRGAKSLLAAGLAKLRHFPDEYREMALAELRMAAGQWAEKLGTEEDREMREPPRIRLAARASQRNKHRE
jgi:uncharacterized protein